MHHKYLMNRSNLIILLLATSALVLGASWYIAESREEAVAAVAAAAREQQETLVTLATLVKQNRTDALTDQIVRDCVPADRRAFEQQLNRLQQLNATELDELQTLFDACAYYVAERKTLMVLRLEHAYEQFQTLVTVLTTLDADSAALSDSLALWQEVVAIEAERSQLLTELVDIQGSIISEFRLAEPNQEQIQLWVERSDEITNRNIVLNQRIAEIDFD